MQFQQDLVLKPSQAQVAFGEEVPRAAGWVKHANRAYFQMKVFKRLGARAARHGLGARFFKLCLQIIQE